MSLSVRNLEPPLRNWIFSITNPFRKRFGSVKITSNYCISTCVILLTVRLLWGVALIKFSCLMLMSDLLIWWIFRIRGDPVVLQSFHSWALMKTIFSKFISCQNRPSIHPSHITFSLHLGNPLLNSICILNQLFLGCNHLYRRWWKLVFDVHGSLDISAVNQITVQGELELPETPNMSGWNWGKCV